MRSGGIACIVGRKPVGTLPGKEFVGGKFVGGGKYDPGGPEGPAAGVEKPSIGGI